MSNLDGRFQISLQEVSSDDKLVQWLGCFGPRLLRSMLVRSIESSEMPPTVRTYFEGLIEQINNEIYQVITRRNESDLPRSFLVPEEWDYVK